MKKILVAVRDSKADYYGAPVAADSRSIAIRQFLDLARDKNTQIGLHPEDFALFCVGEFDIATGMIECCAPSHLCNATEAVNA